MNGIFVTYVIAVGLTIAAMLVLARTAWLRRSIPGTIPFTLAMLSIAQAASMYLLFTITPDPGTAFIWTKLRFVGLAFVPLLYFIFIMHYTGKKHWMTRRVILALCVIPLITQIVLWFGPTTLFFRNWELVRAGSFSMEDSQFKGWFWVHFAYSNILLLAVMGRLAYFVLRVDRSATSALWIIVGVLLGMLGAVPGITIGPPPGLKFAPLGLGLTGLATMIALLRYHLFDIMPVAYDAIFKSIQDAIILTNDQQKVIQANPAALRLLQSRFPALIGADIRDILELDKTSVQTGTTSIQTELLVVCDRDTASYDVRLSPLYQQNRFVGQLAVLHDITERKRAEARFRALLESAPDAMVIVNQQGKIVLVNSQTEAVFGYTREELIGNPIELLVPPDVTERHLAQRNVYIGEPHTRGMGVGLDLNAVRKDGSQFPVEISLSPIDTAEGVLIASTVRDITERKLADKRFQALLDSAPDAMVIVNAQSSVVLVNSQAVSLFGYSREELVGKSIDLLIPERFHSRHHVQVDEYVSGTQPRRKGTGMGLDLYAVRKDGSQFPVEISLSPIDTVDGVLIASAVRDITERKHAEYALRENQQTLQTFFAVLPVGVSVINNSGQIVEMNPALKNIMNLSDERLASGAYRSRRYIHADGTSFLPTEFPSTRAITERKPIYGVEIGIVKENGAVVWTSVSAAPLPPTNTSAIVVTVDVTANKQIEAALRESEGRFRQIMKHLDQAVWLREANLGPIIYMSPAYETITGHSAQRLFNNTASMLDVVHPEDSPYVAKSMAGNSNAEFRVVRPDGTIRWVSARVFPIEDDDTQLHRVAGITEDITERKLAEQRTLELGMEKERVKLLSNFIRDISHEFRTPLAVIDSTSYILTRTENVEQREVLRKRVDTQVSRLVQILEQTLTMSELDTQRPETFITHAMSAVQVANLIDEVITDLSTLIEEKHLHITITQNPSLTSAAGNSDTLSEAVRNIVQNAVHYTPEGGSITVQTRQTDSAFLIEVADNGIGIDADDITHIFERLYRANKARTFDDSGTGLGLSIAKRILELHRGTIEVESVAGQGSTFRLVLPLADR